MCAAECTLRKSGLCSGKEVGKLTSSKGKGSVEDCDASSLADHVVKIPATILKRK